MRKGGAAATRAHNDAERARSMNVTDSNPVASAPVVGEVGARQRDRRLMTADRLAWIGALSGGAALLGELLHAVLS